MKKISYYLVMVWEILIKGRGAKLTIEDTVSEPAEKIKIVETREIAVEKKYTREKSKATYYKNKCGKINENLNKTSSDLKYYENLSCEQKEKFGSGKINTIVTFKGGKYSDEIRQVCYEMLCGNLVGKLEIVVTY